MLTQAVAREEPTFRLALLGFTSGEQDLIQACMAGSAATPRWRLGPVLAADAWLIHGARARPLEGAGLRVDPGAPQHRSVRLDLREVTRPVAFALPLPPGLRSARLFDLASPPSVRRAIQQIEERLLPVRARFALGREVVRGGASFRHAVFHLVGARDALLAVLDFRTGEAALAAGLRPGDIATATWLRQTSPASEVPAGFTVMTTAQLSWTYARHSEAELLPPPYRERTIYYRGVPRVPLAWVTDEQLLLLRELTASPRTLATLCERTGLDVDQAMRELSGLYFAAAITSTPSKAEQRAHRSHPPGAEAADDESPSLAPEEFEPATLQEPTIPGSLFPVR